MVSPQPRQRCPPLLGLEGERRMALLVLLLVVGFVWSAGISQALDRFDDESEEGEHSDFENLVGFGRDVTDGPPVVSRVRRSRHRSGSTPLSGGRDARQQQPPCAVAMSCDMQPLAGNVSSKEARRTFRVESIKDEMLRKLRMDSAPNITTRRQRDLNSMQRFFNQYQRGRYQPMMQPDEPNEEEYSTPISLIVQSQTVPRPAFNTSDACYFQLSSPAFRPNQVVSAQLGVFLRSRYGLAPPTDGSIRQLLVLRNYRRQQQQQSVGRNYTGESYRSKMLNASNPNHFGRWHFFDVRSLVQAWVNHPDRNWGITIAVSDSSLQPLVMVQPRRTAEEALRPFIEVKVRPSSGVRVTRSTGPDCSDDSQERRCCRYPLTIDFDAFRWDWIVAPKRYEAYYCAGECPFLYYQSNPHTHLIQQITPRSAPCCAPTHVSSLPIIYMDDKAKRIFHMSIPGMIVDRCGCS